MKNHVCLVSPTQLRNKIPKCTLRNYDHRSLIPTRAQYILPGQNYFVPNNNGTKQFCPLLCPGDKTYSEQGDEVQIAHPVFLAALLPRPVTMMWLPASSRPSLPPPPIIPGTDADGGGRRQRNDRLALAPRDSASSNANAHGGRMTSSNDVMNEGGGAGDNAPGRVHRPQSTKKRQRWWQKQWSWQRQQPDLGNKNLDDDSVDVDGKQWRR